MKKPEFKAHILVVDTNIVWNEDKDEIANPEFQEFWGTHAAELPIELAIPEMSFLELKYQHHMSALRAMNKATDALKHVSSVTAASYRHRVTEKNISTRISQKFEKWRRKHNALIIITPYTKISWKNIVENAVWRRPPFEEGNRKDRSEKGFRDSVILETIVEMVSKVSTEKTISFVCDDKLLRETADRRLKDVERFSVFESLDEFEAYLRLLKEDLTNQFIRSILRKVAFRFFKKGDDKCLYYTFDLRTLMSDKAGPYSNSPTLAEPRAGLLGLGDPEKWKSEHKGQYWIYPPVFQKLVQGNVYHWSVKIDYAQKFEMEPTLLANVLQSGLGTKLLLLEFRIDWTIKIGAKARLWDPKLVSVELSEKSFKYPTDEQRKEYSLEDES